MLNRQRRLQVDLPWLRRFASVALKHCVEESGDALFTLQSLEEVVVTVVSDRRIGEIHWDFMAISGATDVITFQHGEVVLSADTAERYSQEQRHGLQEELALYVVHGFLHLNGYLDGTVDERTRMHAVQDHIWERCLALCPR